MTQSFGDFHTDLQERKATQNNFPTMTAAINKALKAAEKKGYTTNADERFTTIGTGPAKPRPGKTNRYSLSLYKNGKMQKKMLHIQIYGKENAFELNQYIM